MDYSQITADLFVGTTPLSRHYAELRYRSEQDKVRFPYNRPEIPEIQDRAYPEHCKGEEPGSVRLKRIIEFGFIESSYAGGYHPGKRNCMVGC